MVAATEKQLNFMKSLKLTIPPEGLTKEEARNIIEEALSKQISEATKSAIPNGQLAMYVSYVKDLVVSGKDEEASINLIKKAIKELS